MERVAAEKVRRIEYKCVQCGHEDYLKWWIDDPQGPPVMLTCTSPKCRAGYNKPIEEMIQTGEGMATTMGQTVTMH